MDGFVGRAEELKYLNNVYSKVPVSCALCGRRHLGKTAILKEFCKDKNHIYLTGMPGIGSDNLAGMAKAISRFSGKATKLDDIIDLFPLLKSVCGKKKVVVVIDRYSDLVENFPEFNSYVRSFMNRDIANTKIMLIVCDTDSSIFGRFYYTLDVKAMNYLDCKGFHPDYTPMQHMVAYSIVGGTPAYQNLFKDDPLDTIRDQFFDHMSVFSLEAEGMVVSEAMIRPACIKILSAMASGAESIREISSRSDLSNSICTKLVEDMEHKGMLVKEVSSGPSRRSVYSMNSNILRFFYEVVNKYTHQVEFESTEEAYAAAEGEITAYMERSFKTICMDYVTLKYDYTFVGKLRKKDDTTDSIVDFVASINENDIPRTVIATCDLYGDELGKKNYDSLVSRGKSITGANKLYMMFSGNGFSKELRDMASNDRNIRLLTLDDIYSD